MNVLPITIEAMVAILLLFTILYCVRLNAQLKRLKADEFGDEGDHRRADRLDREGRARDRGPSSTVREADDTLGEHLKEAERFCIEIKTSTEAGADVLNRISQIAGARPWLLGVAPAQPKPDPAAPDPKLIMAAAKALAERAHARARAA